MAPGVDVGIDTQRHTTPASVVRASREALELTR